MPTVLDIKLKAIADMQALVDYFDTKEDLFMAVARQSGVSHSMARKIYYGQRQNPGVSTLDSLVAGIDQLMERMK